MVELEEPLGPSPTALDPPLLRLLRSLVVGTAGLELPRSLYTHTPHTHTHTEKYLKNSFSFFSKEERRRK